MKVRKLTERQNEVLNAIRAHIRQHGIPPSRSELARRLNLRSQTAVDQHLNALAKKGWIQLLPWVDRGIRLLREGVPIFEDVQIPAVSAGNPILAEEHNEPARLSDFESLALHFDAKPDYFLRVKGDSMDRVGFRTGDMVAVKRNPDPHNGDIVIARIGEEITLKRFRRIDEHIVELRPESNNPEHETICIDALTEDFAIVGVVVGAIMGARSEKDYELAVGTR